MPLVYYRSLKDHIIKIADQKMQLILPTSVQRIVISYVLTPERVSEEVEELDRLFADETMKPFRKIVTQVAKFMEDQKIYDKKSDILKYKGHPIDEMIGTILAEIPPQTIEDVLDFLSAINRDEWDSSYKEACFTHAKGKVKKIYDLTSDYKNPRKKYINKIILFCINKFVFESVINNSQNSNILIDLKFHSEVESISPLRLVEKMIASETRVSKELSRSFKRLALLGLLTLGGVGAFIAAAGITSNDMYLIGMVPCLAIAGVLFYMVCCKRQDNIDVMNTGFGKIDSNIANIRGIALPLFQSNTGRDLENLNQSLLTSEQRSEYKEEKSFNARSPDLELGSYSP